MKHDYTEVPGSIPLSLVILPGTQNVGEKFDPCQVFPPFGFECSGQENQRGLYSRDSHIDVSAGVSYKIHMSQRIMKKQLLLAPNTQHLFFHIKPARPEREMALATTKVETPPTVTFRRSFI